MSDVAQAVRRYYETVDTAGPEATTALFAENGVYRRPGYDAMEGREVIGEFYRSQRVIVNGAHTLDAVIIQGNDAAVRGRFRGELRDGSAVEVGFADFMTFDEDLIAERTTYFYRPAV